MRADDTVYIKRVLRLARRAEGMTSPNPMVGALLVKDGDVLAEDFHRRAGTPHAEALVLRKAGKRAEGATLYVNLEPCCHTEKRTPPCTEAIIRAGVKRVVASMIDPNPKVSGRGIEMLRNAGIEVDVGICEAEARRLNEAYEKYITTGLPFVTLKVAMSLDGKVALPTGESKWITSEKSRRMVQRMRAAHDCILTGIGTVRADDPSLTVRLRAGRSPTRVVVDPHLDIDPGAKILMTPPDTILVTEVTGGEKMEKLLNRGIEIMTYKDGLDFQWLMRRLGEKGFVSVMVEAGSTLPSYMLRAGVVDKVVFFVAPKILGGRDSFPAIGGPSCGRLKEAYQLKDLKVKRVGEDLMIEGYLR